MVERIFEFAEKPRGMAHAARVLIHGRGLRTKERLAYWAVHLERRIETIENEERQSLAQLQKDVKITRDLFLPMQTHCLTSRRDERLACR
jgi:hypothetical protein